MIGNRDGEDAFTYGDRTIGFDVSRLAALYGDANHAARLAALSCAPASAAEKLTADLSRGKFERKWGALPVALWLDEESRRPPPRPPSCVRRAQRQHSEQRHRRLGFSPLTPLDTFVPSPTRKNAADPQSEG